MKLKLPLAALLLLLASPRCAVGGRPGRADETEGAPAVLLRGAGAPGGVYLADDLAQAPSSPARDQALLRIINGKEAQEGQYPFTVSLQDGIGHFCGGSLIARDVVLSAAHCQGGRFDVVIGRHDLNVESEGQKIEVDREVPHPEYVKSMTDNDYMLIYLKEPADEAYDVISPNSDPDTPSVDSMVNVMGWGDTDAEKSGAQNSEVLMEVDVVVISNRDCRNSEGDTRKGKFKKYEGRITDNMLCAHDFKNGEDSCQGDSGGPLVQDDVLVGVVSWGLGCATSSFPGVYARVSRAYDWGARPPPSP